MTSSRTQATAAPVEPEQAGVALHDVSIAFGPLAVLDGVSLRADAGETVAIVGPSGCGKSTLLDIVCGLATPGVSGRVTSGRAVLMPQRDGLLPWLTAQDNAALGLRVAGASRRDARVATRPALAALGLAGFEDARPAALSGGMRQRVAFVRTLLTGAPVLCLDEPFGALDALTRAETQRWLAEALEREPRTVLLVTHDVEEAVLLADRVVVLSPRPARVLETIDIPLDRAQRTATDPEVVALRARVLEVLGA